MASTVKVDSFKGSLNSDASPQLADVIRGLVDDVNAAKGSAIATADAAVTAVANASDAGTAATLANDLKAKYNAMVTLVNEMKVQLNAAVATAGASASVIKG